MDTDKPVTRVSDEGDLEQMLQERELVGVEDNAIIFRQEVIITDEEIKDRVAERMGSALDNFGVGAGTE